MQDSVYKTINRETGRAIHAYDMIQDGDRIAVGLSGGKDSLTLLYTLMERQGRVPVNYELFPIYVDPGFQEGYAPRLERYCQDAGIRLIVEYTDNGIVAHGPQNRENPCFLCSRLRRKRLFEIAGYMGCRKIALGHHKDDLIETLFLNMCFAGEISTMVPRQSFFNGKITVIRPLAFVEEALICRFVRKRRFPTFVNTCPSASNSKRREIKDLLCRLYRSNKKIKGNLFRALSHVRQDYLL